MESVPETDAVDSNAPATTAGEKVTLTVQLAPAARVVQLLVWANCELEVEIADTVIELAPLLVNVTACAGEVVPIDWPPKSIEAGVVVAARAGSTARQPIASASSAPDKQTSRLAAAR